MFYFFQKGREYLRCEIRTAAQEGFDLRIEEPGLPERLERYASFEDAIARWEELRVGFNVDGWAGPFGRE